jgi:hypothetical protein
MSGLHANPHFAVFLRKPTENIPRPAQPPEIIKTKYFQPHRFVRRLIGSPDQVSEIVSFKNHCAIANNGGNHQPKNPEQDSVTP